MLYCDNNVYFYYENNVYLCYENNVYIYKLTSITFSNIKSFIWTLGIIVLNCTNNKRKGKKCSWDLSIAEPFSKSRRNVKLGKIGENGKCEIKTAIIIILIICKH